MKIGIIDEFREKQITGINRVVSGTLEELLIQDQNNEYFFVGRTDYLPIKLEAIDIFFDKSSEIDLNYLMLTHDIDIIHSFYRAYKFSDKIKCGKVLTIHDLIMLTHPEVASKDVHAYFDGPLRRCANAVDTIIAVSNHTKNDIIEHYGIDANKIEVISPGLYPRREGKKINIKNRFLVEKGNYILSVSGLTKYKNQIGLIKSFAVFKSRHPECKLKLVLTGPPRMNMEGIFDEIRKVPDYEKNVIYTGYVSETELLWLYQNCLVYMLVSWYEGFGLTILEALSQGKAVICSNTTSMPEVGGEAAEYCNSFEIESIVDAMENVILCESRRLELEKKSIVQAQKFDYSITAKKTLELYKSFS